MKNFSQRAFQLLSRRAAGQVPEESSCGYLIHKVQQKAFVYRNSPDGILLQIEDSVLRSVASEMTANVVPYFPY